MIVSKGILQETKGDPIYKHGKQQETWSEAELNALKFRYIKYGFVVLETLPPTQMRAFLNKCRWVCAEVKPKTVLQCLTLKVVMNIV